MTAAMAGLPPHGAVNLAVPRSSTGFARPRVRIAVAHAAGGEFGGSSSVLHRRLSMAGEHPLQWLLAGHIGICMQI